MSPRVGHPSARVDADLMSTTGVPSKTSIVFDRGRVAISMDGTKFLGLITRTDLLADLRRQMASSSATLDREFS